MASKLFFHNAFTNRQVFYMQEGSRPWYAMILVYDGTFTFTLKGKNFTVNKNEVAFFPKDIVFTRAVTKPISFHQFGFHADADESDLPADDCGKLNLPEEYVVAVTDMLNTLEVSDIKKRSRIYQNVIDNILIADRVFSAQKSVNKANADKDVAFVVEYMYDHLNEKINIYELAEQLHLTHTGLILKFKRVYDCTPNEYLIKLRMKFAGKLLAEGQLRINEIATMCGYSNAYYFSNAFRNYFGMTPSEYRKSKKIT